MVFIKTTTFWIAELVLLRFIWFPSLCFDPELIIIVVLQVQKALLHSGMEAASKAQLSALNTVDTVLKLFGFIILSLTVFILQVHKALLRPGAWIQPSSQGVRNATRTVRKGNSSQAVRTIQSQCPGTAHALRELYIGSAPALLSYRVR